MDTLIDSTFLPLLLKGAGFLMLVMLLWPIARRQSAALHSIYWRSAMLGLLVLGIFSLWVPILTFEWARSDAGVEAQPVSELVPLTTGSPSGEWRVLETAAGERSPGGGAVTGSLATAAVGRRLVNPLLALWLAGSLLLSVRWIVARVRLSRLCASEPQGSHWAKLIGECQLAVGMRGRVRVAIDHKVAMPCAWGILRPTLMLPAGAERWDAGRQRMVLMHELSHLKRHDPLHDGIARLCVTLFWMNPLVWLAARQSRLAAERATDDAVIAAGCPSKSYADLLLQFAREAVAGRNAEPVLATPMAQGSTVGLRVEKILDSTQQRGAPGGWSICLLLGMVCLAAAMLGGVQEARAQEPAPEPLPQQGETGGGEDADVGAGGDDLPPLKVVHPEGSRYSIKYTADKLRRIVLPRVILSEATLEEAIEYFQGMSAQHDKLEKEDHHKGVKILLKKKGAGPDAPAPSGLINLDLRNIPLHDALGFATKVVDYQFKIEPGAVIVVPQWGASNQLITQTFRVPPDFLTAGKDGARKSAVKILQEVGIEFPDGASAVFILATSELVVRNTGQNMDLIQVFIDDVISRANRPVVNMRAEIYRLAKLEALELMERYEEKSDASAAVTELRKLLADGDAQLVSSPSLSTVGGEVALIGAGTNYRYVDGYEARDGKDVPLEKEVFKGTKIEFKANVFADEFTISVDTKLDKSFGDPQIERATVAAPVSGKQMPVERVSLEQGSIHTQTKLFSGQTRLLGVLTPEGAGSDVAEIVLMKVWLSKMVK